MKKAKRQIKEKLEKQIRDVWEKIGELEIKLDPDEVANIFNNSRIIDNERITVERYRPKVKVHWRGLCAGNTLAYLFDETLEKTTLWVFK